MSTLQYDVMVSGLLPTSAAPMPDGERPHWSPLSHTLIHGPTEAVIPRACPSHSRQRRSAHARVLIGCDAYCIRHDVCSSISRGPPQGDPALFVLSPGGCIRTAKPC